MTNVNAEGAVPSAHAARLRGHRLFADTPDAVLAGVADGAYEASRAAGEYFFHEGEPATHYLLMLEGRVDMVRVGMGGEERVARFFAPGELVAEPAMFMAHGGFPMAARAAEPSRALCLLREPLREACLRHPPLALQLLEAVCGRLYRTVNEVTAFALASASQRLAAYLLEQSAEQGAPRLELPLATHQLAGHLGVRAETLSRIFAQWVRDGLVAGRGRSWELLQVESLQRLAQAVQRPS